MKPQIRILGIDDAHHTKDQKEVLIIGTIYRGGEYLDGLLSTKITKDGDDSTKKLIETINSSKYQSQIRAVFLNGITLGGFNIVDIKELANQTKIPVIAIIRNKPDIELIKQTLIKLNTRNKISLIEKAGKIIKVGEIYIQLAGCSFEQAEELLKLTCTHSNIPEALRAAHLIATGISLGESRGKA